MSKTDVGENIVSCQHVDPRDASASSRTPKGCVHSLLNGHIPCRHTDLTYFFMASVGSLGGVPAGSASSSARTESLKPSQPMAHSQPIGTSSPPPVVHPLNSAAGMPPPGSQTLWSARLMDLLNLVRHEFDVIGNDAVHFKSQRDELEHRSTLTVLLTPRQLHSSSTR